MKQLTKEGKKHFRKLAAIAHERELGNELDKLLSEFHRWKKEEINAFELNELIHKHHDGISRDLYKMYVYADPDVAVSYAIAGGVLKEEEVDPRFLQFIESLIEMYRRNM